MAKKSIIMKDIEQPRKLEVVEETPNYGKIEIEPFMSGFGVTLGHAMRRMLLSSIVGAAVTSIKIQGIKHEFATLSGMQEDIIDLIFNLKKLAIKVEGTGPEKLTLDVKGDAKTRVVTAADIKTKAGVEIINPELVLAHLNEDGHLKMELEVEIGRGYVGVDLKSKAEEIGRIHVDAMFSPVRKVNYRVEKCRVGQVTDFDKLIMEIWTNGAISVADAVAYAAKIIKEHMQVFINFDEVEEAEEAEEEMSPEELRLFDLLGTNVEEMELSVRASNCLRGANITSLIELVTMTEAELLKTRNFGSKSAQEIAARLTEMNLQLGMRPQIEELRAKAARIKKKK